MSQRLILVSIVLFGLLFLALVIAPNRLSSAVVTDN